LVCICVKWGAHPVNRNDCSTAEYAFIQTVAMDLILDDHTRWDVCPVGWVCGCKANILTTEVLVVASKAHGVFGPIEWLPQVVSNRPRANRRWWFQLNRVNFGMHDE